MKRAKIIFGVIILLAVVSGIAMAQTVNRERYGIAVPRIYDLDYGTNDIGSFYLDIPTLAADDTFCGLTSTQTLTNKTLTSPTVTGPTISSATAAGANPIAFDGATAGTHKITMSITDPTGARTWTIPDADVNLGAIANTLLAAPKSYTITALTHDGPETGTVDPVFTFQMPFAATLIEVSICARDIDTGDANETYTIDIEEAGTTVLSSAIAIVADNTAVVGTVSDSAIADNAKIEIVLTLGGTSPQIDDLSVILTFAVAHTT